MLSDIFTQLIERKEFYFDLLLEHLEISLISIFIATLIGLFLGIIISEYEKTSKFVLGIVNFIYTIPSISLLGFLIPISGIGNFTAIIALSIYALLPMVRNTHTGIINIDERIVEAAKGMGSTRLQILFKIKLPLAMAVIISGLRSMVTMTIALAGIASFIGAGGLGVAIYRGITTNNPSMTMVGSLLIAILAIVIDIIIGFFEKVTSRNSSKDKKIKIVSLAIAIILLLGLIGQGLFKSNESVTINMASKPMTEQYIVSHMVKEIVEKETDLKVNLTQGVGGGTSNIMPAMESGEFDMYIEYTSTGWNMVLNHGGFYDETMYEDLKKEYGDKYNFTWTGLFGFNDTYGIAVKKDIAEKYNLETYSDLALISKDLVFGAEYDFYERPDGYDALSSLYGFKFKNTVDLDIGLKYQAINEGKVDVMDIFTTDGQLSVSDLVVLKDDKNFFSSAMAAIVIRNDTLEKYPEIAKAFERLEGILDDEKMAYLNYLVEGKGKDAKEVAHEFLIEEGILE